MGLTRKRNLRTGAPVWSAYRHLRIATKRLTSNRRVEVLVIGAGISGALVSHALTEIGYRPLILDRRSGAHLGSTPASTALLQFELDTPLTKLARSAGRRAAEKIWICSRDAVNTLRSRADRLGISARLHTRPSLYLAGDELDARGLAREVKARQRIGLASEFLDRKALKEHFDIERSAAILNHANLEADPVSLAAGFLAKAIQNGARFHAPHEVVDVNSTRRGVEVSTRDGIEIMARHVIICTGYELPKIVPQGSNTIVSTWAIATRPQPKRIWPQRALIWEASDPYLYARSTADGRVICGGEDENFGDAQRRDELLPVKTRAIESKLGKLFPLLDTKAAFAWTGSFGASPTGTPTIGAVPGHRGCYAVLGYGGNGITFSMLAANLISAQVAGRPLPESKLFAFS